MYIVLLQATWLVKYKLSLLGNISNDFYAICITGMETGEGIVNGRPYGGLAFMWRKSLGSYCEPIVYNNEA
jgi:hypothetical protein